MPSGKSKKEKSPKAALLQTLPAAGAPVPEEPASVDDSEEAEEVLLPGMSATMPRISATMPGIKDPTEAPVSATDETVLPAATRQGIKDSTKSPVSAIDQTALPDCDSNVGSQSRPTSSGELSLARGDALGRYVVLDLLGKGGMGEVYSAYDPTLDRKVALKVLRPALTSGSSVTTARARLTHEAKAMAKLAHPNVIQVFDVGTVAGDVYVAMEFVDGVSLKDWLDKDRSVDEILAIFQSAALGLAAAHEAGLVHRDFKPDNVLIGNDGRVRVIDFGIASLGGTEEKNADAIIEELTRSQRNVGGAYTTLTGVAAGTPAYMAPEQFLALACDARTDQFSFAVALYEALYKERPFVGAKIAELSHNVCEGNRRPTPDSSVVPAWVQGALSRSLLPKPDDRHQSMHALLDALTPTRSWFAKQRMAVLIAAPLLALVIMALALVPGDEEDKPCQSDESLAAGVWDSERKASLEEHFAKSALPYANDTASKIVDQLDTHADSWQLARKNLCLAAVRKDITEDLKVRGMSCLDRRLRELDAVGTILSSASDEIIKNAAIVASELSPIADCTNTTLLAHGGEALPPQWQEIDDSFAGLKALFSAGQHKELLEQAQAVDALALERGFALGHGEALNWIGTGERALSKYEDAEEHFFEAIRVGQKEKSARIRAVAWEGLMSVAGSNDRPKEGLRWHKHAVLANEEAGVDPELQARMTYIHGFLHYKMQNYELALGRFQASAALYGKIFGPTHWRVSSNLSLASASLRQLGRFDEALANSQEAVRVAKASLGPDHPRMASIHNGAANTLGRVMRFDEAREHYKEALRLTTATFGERSANVAMYLNNLAIMELRVGEYEEALRLAEKALELRKEVLGDGNAGVARTLLGIATAHYRLGDLKQALKIQGEATQRFQLIYGDAHRTTAGSKSGLCDYLRRAKQYSKARVACTAALKVLDPDAPDPRDLAKALTVTAWLDVEEGKKQIALERAERAWALRLEHTSKESFTGQTRFVLAMALHLNGKVEEAREHAERAKRTIESGEPGARMDVPALVAFLSRTAPNR